MKTIALWLFMACLAFAEPTTNVIVVKWPAVQNMQCAILGRQTLSYTVLNLPVEPERYANGNTERNKYNVPGGGFHFLGFSTNGTFRYTNVAGRIDYLVDVDCPGYGWNNCITNRVEQWVYSTEYILFDIWVFRGAPATWDISKGTVWNCYPDYVGGGWWRNTNGPINIQMER